jgi:hypothetical protein
VTAAFIGKMREVGVDTIVRYYDHVDETIEGKTLRFAERLEIAEAGFEILVVFQHNNNEIATFRDRRRGAADAARSLALAAEIGQPVGSAIYFGVDGPWRSPADLGDIVRYFSDIRRVFEARGGQYRVGVYGGGLVCRTLLDRKLADHCWLANATSWPGYEEFLASKRWTLRQLLTGKCGDREVDFNLAPPGTARFGQFR